MNNFSMNSDNHNQPPPSPRKPRGGNGDNNSHPSPMTPTAAARSSFGFGGGSAAAARRPARKPRNEALEHKIAQMALPLAPLVQLTSGQAHPAFPATLLSFWLLTSAQLDELAAFYHQRWPCALSRHYPCPVTWAEDLTLEEKRRKIGKFIGLRGCDTPVYMRTEEQIIAAARQARLRDDDDEALRRKTSGFY